MSGTSLVQHNSAVGWEKCKSLDHHRQLLIPGPPLLQTRGELYLDHTCDAEVSQDNG